MYGAYARSAAEASEHARVAGELAASTKRFAEYERRDIQLREGLKHIAAKRRKFATKLKADAAKIKVSGFIGWLGGKFGLNQHPLPTVCPL